MHHASHMTCRCLTLWCDKFTPLCCINKLDGAGCCFYVTQKQDTWTNNWSAVEMWDFGRSFVLTHKLKLHKSTLHLLFYLLCQVFSLKVPPDVYLSRPSPHAGDSCGLGAARFPTMHFTWSSNGNDKMILERCTCLVSVKKIPYIFCKNILDIWHQKNWYFMLNLYLHWYSKSS